MRNVRVPKVGSTDEELLLLLVWAGVVFRRMSMKKRREVLAEMAECLGPDEVLPFTMDCRMTKALTGARERLSERVPGLLL